MYRAHLEMVVKETLHLTHLITLERRSHQHYRPHGGHHVIWGDVLRLRTRTHFISGSRLITR